MNCPKCGHPDYYTSLFGGGSCLSPTCDDATGETRRKAGNHFVDSLLEGEAVHRKAAFACTPSGADDCPECGANPGECHFSCGQYEAPEDLESLVEDFGIECTAIYGANLKPCWDPNWPHHPYRITLRREEEVETVPTAFSVCVDFFTGTGAGEPTATDVLYCLVQDTLSVRNTSSFEEWAENLGFDPDSRKAEASYRACMEQADEVEAFLGDHFDVFAEAEH